MVKYALNVTDSYAMIVLTGKGVMSVLVLFALNVMMKNAITGLICLFKMLSFSQRENIMGN